MNGAYRLPGKGRVDHERRLNFNFNGRRYEGLAGDTLASALLANGVVLVARSFKYHRPRGIMTAGAEEPNALVQLETGPWSEPNIRATQIELYSGLEARSVNAWPSVGFDIGALNGLFARLFVAGFYYKTFMRPKLLWERLYEPAIRRMAGMGKAPTTPDPEIYDKMHAHCDLLVVGGGPAGLAAALAGARSDARVFLVDEQNELGGSLLSRRAEIEGAPAMEWVAKAVEELEARANVTLLTRASAFGYYDHNYLGVVERRTDHIAPSRRPLIARQRLWHLRAKEVVLATGAIERPLVFADNDRPGIMLASAAQSYVNRYGLAPGKRAVVFTNNDGAYEAALDLLDAGIEVAAIVDPRSKPEGELAALARKRGIEVLASAAITATRGRKRIAAVEVMTLEGDRVRGPRAWIGCDLLAMSGGWNPTVHLFCQAKGRLRYDATKACLVPDDIAQATHVTGAANGGFELAAVLGEGFAAGRAAASRAGFESPEAPPITATSYRESPLHPLWIVPSVKPLGRGHGKHFVDFQNDITAADILLAAREGYESVEHLKRYTTTGMGTDQGKLSNVNALAILSGTLGQSIPETGTTTFRAPYTPVSYGVLAGRDIGDLSDPIRITAIHEWHLERGAVFEDVGQWKRPWYFPRKNEDMAAALKRECKAVRESVGVLDASTLGKIDIQGPDAVEFLNRIYTNGWSTLKYGQSRYGMMCHEDGMVFDDGVTTRLGENHFLMTTTTGNAGPVLDWLESWLQTEWPELRVYCTSVTDQWVTVSIAGPKARKLLGELAPEIALDGESFPFMTFRQGKVAGVEARLFRVSFTGELSFEINVPSWHGLHVWEAVMAAGEKHDITPYGTETMHVLRAEKGFVIVGQDTDGTVTPEDLGMGWIVSKKKDFLGRRSFARVDTARSDRKQLVGLLPDDPKEVLPEGAQLVGDANARSPMARSPMVGHVTSSYASAVLERSFALALVKGGRARIGETLYAPLVGKTVAARITEPVFFDPKNERRDG
ncbi:MAG: sarcosine oxidase subunit alpha [Alphaproteobacteria bacterium]